MSRKVYIEADVIVNVPVKVRIHRIVRADEDANLHSALKADLRKKTYSKADVEADPSEESEIIEVNGSEPPSDDYTDPSDCLPDVVNELIEAGKARLIAGSVNIIDSK